MGHRTPLYQQHLDAGARVVDFGGWDMPIQYQSLIEEHHAVRQHAGIFDVSHMTVVDVNGADAKAWLQYLLANDVDRLKEEGKALYSAMLRRPPTRKHLITWVSTFESVQQEEVCGLFQYALARNPRVAGVERCQTILELLKIIASLNL